MLKLPEDTIEDWPKGPLNGCPCCGDIAVNDLSAAQHMPSDSEGPSPGTGDKSFVKSCHLHFDVVFKLDLLKCKRQYDLHHAAPANRSLFVPNEETLEFLGDPSASQQIAPDPLCSDFTADRVLARDVPKVSLHDSM